MDLWNHSFRARPPGPLLGKCGAVAPPRVPHQLRRIWRTRIHSDGFTSRCTHTQMRSASPTSKGGSPRSSCTVIEVNAVAHFAALLSPDALRRLAQVKAHRFAAVTIGPA